MRKIWFLIGNWLRAMQKGLAPSFLINRVSMSREKYLDKTDGKNVGRKSDIECFLLFQWAIIGYYGKKTIVFPLF